MSKPVKSEDGLTRCSVCRQHIRAADRPSQTDCPFCGANLLRRGPSISLPTGRGGILAASLLMFSAGGCGGSEAEEPPATITEVATEPSADAVEPPAADEPQAAAPDEPQAEEGSLAAAGGSESPTEGSGGEAQPEQEVPEQEAPEQEAPEADETSEQAQAAAEGPAPSQPARPQPADEFDSRPAQRPRPQARYGLAPGRRPRPDRPARVEDVLEGI